MTCGSLLRKVFRVVQELVKSHQNLIQSTARLSEHADFGRPQRSAESGRESEAADTPSNKGPGALRSYVQRVTICHGHCLDCEVQQAA